VGTVGACLSQKENDGQGAWALSPAEPFPSPAGPRAQQEMSTARCFTFTCYPRCSQCEGTDSRYARSNKFP